MTTATCVRATAARGPVGSSRPGSLVPTMGIRAHPMSAMEIRVNADILRFVVSVSPAILPEVWEDGSALGQL